MLLPGHGGHYRELYKVSWRDWYAEAEREFMALRSGRGRANIVGFSIGAAVAMELAANHKVDRLVLINTPLFYFYQFLPQRLLLGVLNLLAREIRTFAIGGSGASLIYPRIPVKVLYTMGELVHRARKRAREISCPTLIVHSTHDLASRAKSAEYLMRTLASRTKKLVWVRDRDHSILQGDRRLKVFAEIESFLKSGD
jgi:carboxylesterase